MKLLFSILPDIGVYAIHLEIPGFIGGIIGIILIIFSCRISEKIFNKYFNPVSKQSNMSNAPQDTSSVRSNTVTRSSKKTIMPRIEKSFQSSNTTKRSQTKHRKKTLEEMLEENKRISEQISASSKTAKKK